MSSIVSWLPDYFYEADMKKALLPAISLVTLCASPAFSADDELLRAALKKIEALDNRMSSLEAENKSLRAELYKNKVAVAKSQTTMAAETRHAANLGSRAATERYAGTSLPALKSEPREAITNQWSGVYAGLNAGYAVGYVNQYMSGSYGDANGIILNGGSYNNNFIHGGTAGGQFGYNYIFASHVLFGGEADMNWADINDWTSGTNNAFNSGYGKRYVVYPDGTGNASNAYSRLGLNWVGTVRMRLGYDMGRFLPYFTGGFAYGNLSQSETYATYDTFSAAGNLSTGSNSRLSTGWVIGAGAEYMVADNWSVKGEYLYTQLAGISTPVNSFAVQSSDGISATYYNSFTTGSFGYHQFRLGLNYHTGWGVAGNMPIMASY